LTFAADIDRYYPAGMHRRNVRADTGLPDARVMARMLRLNGNMTDGHKHGPAVMVSATHSGAGKTTVTASIITSIFG
jgi:hypothetical protein